MSRRGKYDASKFSFISFDFPCVSRMVYSKAAFTIIADKICNANCSFCAWMQCNKCKRDQVSDAAYLNNLEEAIEKVLLPLSLAAYITGGEPSKSTRLLGILSLLNKYNIPKVVMTTNGSGLLDVMEKKLVIEHLAEHKVKQLNISRAHYDSESNQRIMQFISGADIMHADMMRKIAAYANANNIKMRLSCILLKNGINSIDEMIKYLDFYRKLGIKNVVFREILDIDPADIVNKIKDQYCLENKVSIDDIWKDMDGNNNFELLLSLRRYYYYVEVWKYRDMEIVTTDASLVELEAERRKNPNVVYDLIFHANGKLCSRWTENKDILL